MQLNLIIPKKKYSVSNNTCAWITLGIKTSCNHKRELWKKLQEGKVTMDYFKKYSNILKKVIKQAKVNGHKKYIDESDNKTKATWNLVNAITNNEQRADTIFDSFPLRNEKDLLDELNIHFINTGTNGDRPGSDNDLIKPCNNSIFLIPVVEQEVYQYITRLKNKKSVGNDEIPVGLLKKCATIISKPLTHIINQTMLTGRYPQLLKEAIVKPLYKKGSKEDFDNYRPISLLSNVNKIFERIIFDRMMKFFEENKILANQQCGFRRGKSTIHAIYQALKTIIKSLNEQHATAALCLDLSKAFDRVHHQILIRKLEKYGIRGVALELIKTYLTDRTQKTVSRGLDGKMIESGAKHVQIGVPQGSILGPLLYIIYTNDLVQITDNDVVMFADDTSIICCANNEETCRTSLRNDMENLGNWFADNNLVLNVNKTKLLVFREKDRKIDIKYKGVDIESVESIPFLGVLIDRNLSWKDQIEKVATNIARHCYALRTIRNAVGLDAALTAYHAFFQSRMRYGIIFWARSTEVERVFRLQKRSLRIIFGMKQDESCRGVFRDYRILTLYSLYIYESVMFVLNNFEEFKCMKNDHPYHTRGKNYLIQDRANYTYLQKNVTYSLLKIWNKLPEIFKGHPFHVKKRKLKNFLLNKCYYNLREFLDENNFEGL